jgi:adenosylcobinamide kinase/adenosylcobinamide-phosphate guanylyltransferase
MTYILKEVLHMRTIVLGGAACGKSEYAEALAVLLPVPRFYIATMMPFDKEDDLRIEKHRSMRAEKGFHTMERYTDLAGLVLPDRGTVLLECLGNLTANELFSNEGSGVNTFDAIMSGIERLEAQCDDLVVVSNDIFSDGNAYTDETMRYIETLAAVNRTLSARYERVVELVCGIPLTHKGVKAAL